MSFNIPLVFFYFQFLDNAIYFDLGLAPSDPRKGFLPPNNETSGQGYVTFSVKPKTDVKTMTRIDIKGSIYFDQNEPIDTPLIFNTVGNYKFIFSLQLAIFQSSFKYK